MNDNNPSSQAPDLKQIGEQLIELGKQALELAKQASKTEEAETLKLEAKKAMGELKIGLKKANEDLKTGKLQEDLKRDAKNALDFFSQKLDEIDTEDKKKT